MSKKNITLECNDCQNTCTVHGKNVESVQFCPFCGEGILMAYDDIADTELFNTEFNEGDYEYLDDLNEEVE